MSQEIAQTPDPLQLCGNLASDPDTSHVSAILLKKIVLVQMTTSSLEGEVTLTIDEPLHVKSDMPRTSDGGKLKRWVG